MVILEAIQEQNKQISQQQLEQERINRTRELAGIPRRKFAKSYQEIKREENIEDYNQELQQINAENKKIEEYNKQQIDNLKPEQRAIQGDPSIELYEEYEHQYYLEDTGKRVNGIKVWKVIGHEDWGEFVSNNPKKELHTNTYYGYGGKGELYGKKLDGNNVIDGTLKYSHNGQYVNGKYTVGWYTTNNKLSSGNITTVDTGKYNPSQWTDSKSFPYTDKDYISKVNAYTNVVRYPQDHPNNPTKQYNLAKEEYKQANKEYYQAVRTNKEKQKSYTQRATEEFKMYNARKEEEIKSFLPQYTEYARQDFAKNPKATQVTYDIKGVKVDFFRDTQTTTTRISGIMNKAPIPQKLFLKLGAKDPKLANSYLYYKEQKATAPMPIKIGFEVAETYAIGGAVGFGSKLAVSGLGFGVKTGLKATKLYRPTVKGISFVSSKVNSNIVKKVAKVGFSGMVGYRAKKSYDEKGLSGATETIAKDVAFLYGFGKGYSLGGKTTSLISTQKDKVINVVKEYNFNKQMNKFYNNLPKYDYVPKEAIYSQRTLSGGTISPERAKFLRSEIDKVKVFGNIERNTLKPTTVYYGNTGQTKLIYQNPIAYDTFQNKAFIVKSPNDIMPDKGRYIFAKAEERFTISNLFKSKPTTGKQTTLRQFGISDPLNKARKSSSKLSDMLASKPKSNIPKSNVPESNINKNKKTVTVTEVKPTITRQDEIFNLAPRVKSNFIQYEETTYYNTLPKQSKSTFLSPKQNDVKIINPFTSKSKSNIMPIFKTKEISKTSFNLKLSSSSLSKSRFNFKSNIKQNYNVESVVIQKQKPQQSYKLGVKQRTLQIQELKLKQKLATSDKKSYPNYSNTISPKPEPIIELPPPKILLPIIPFLSKRKTSFSNKKLSNTEKQPKAYTPSGFSAVFQIKGKSNKLGVSTGLGIRPIKQTKKKKKNKVFKL